jgi:hypothetical protein
MLKVVVLKVAVVVNIKDEASSRHSLLRNTCGAHGPTSGIS